MSVILLGHDSCKIRMLESESEEVSAVNEHGCFLILLQLLCLSLVVKNLLEARILHAFCIGAVVGVLLMEFVAEILEERNYVWRN
jgi:uncharacterized protein YebE (UPF0316 family)